MVGAEDDEEAKVKLNLSAEAVSAEADVEVPMQLEGIVLAVQHAIVDNMYNHRDRSCTAAQEITSFKKA